MELRELTEKTLSLLEIETTDEMSKRLLEVVKEGDAKIYEEFDNMVENNLSVDWMQKIFQYYQADRKGKMQDYTPASLARFCGKLTETENENSVYDLCAGSGTTLRAAYELGRSSFGFEIDRTFYKRAKEEMLDFPEVMP